MIPVVFEEWSDNVWRITTHAKEEINTCYLLDCGEEITLIDSGLNERVGKEIFRAIDAMGRKASDLTNVFFTHSHPELLGGLRLVKELCPDVKIHIHSNSKPVFEEGKNYVLAKQFPLESSGGKLSLAWKTPIFENFKDLPKPDVYLQGGEDFRIADETLIIQHSGGHSSDSIIIHAYNAKVTFIGDELGLYNNNEYSFFFDLTGSPDRRSKALRAVQKLKSNYILSSHISPIENEFVDEEVEAAILAQQHFETTLQETLLGFDESRLDTIVNHVYGALSIDWKTPYSELKVDFSTIMKYLELWQSKELVLFNEKTKKYSYNREKLSEDYDPYAPY